MCERQFDSIIAAKFLLLSGSRYQPLHQGAAVKLGKRLQYLHDIITPDYQHIWDCCCDHGQLGAALLQSSQAHVHFVDVVPELIDKLQLELGHYFADYQHRYSTYVMDVARLPIYQDGSKQLVIIAGIGGDLTAELVSKLTASLDDNIDLLLCPVHHHFTLRERLRELDWKLKHESLVEENQRIYEVIYVSQDITAQAVSTVGQSIWQQGALSSRYLAKTLAHYQRVAMGKPEAQRILDAYQGLAPL